ncbi:hypothetical protein M3Y99_00160600 [Aphelenchoides fujianensis]|nr:hypothetical protein M3Y99_00160600 [Aphelenchoides fujianensis]
MQTAAFFCLLALPLVATQSIPADPTQSCDWSHTYVNGTSNNLYTTIGGYIPVNQALDESAQSDPAEKQRYIEQQQALQLQRMQLEIRCQEAQRDHEQKMAQLQKEMARLEPKIDEAKRPICTII